MNREDRAYAELKDRLVNGDFEKAYDDILEIPGTAFEYPSMIGSVRDYESGKVGLIALAGNVKNSGVHAGEFLERNGNAWSQADYLDVEKKDGLNFQVLRRDASGLALLSTEFKGKYDEKSKVYEGHFYTLGLSRETPSGEFFLVDMSDDDSYYPDADFNSKNNEFLLEQLNAIRAK